MTIIISRDGKNAKPIQKTEIKKEDYLQQYIYDNPESVPLYEIKEDIKLLILSREFPTNSGPIDAIGIDKDGQLYIIETKLYKNPDKRLVVAQILDYGAALWKHYNKFDDFLLRIENSIQDKFKESCSKTIRSYFNISDKEAVHSIFENMKSNLEKGNFKFVVLMDKLSDRLRDLIIYINQNSNFDFYAVELDYYQYEDLEIMIPRLFGSEVRKTIGTTTSSGRRKWDEESFFDELGNNLEANKSEAVRKLYKFSAEKGQIDWGTGISRGSFNPKYAEILQRSPFSVYTDGTLAINFGWLHENDKEKRFRDEMKTKIENLQIISFADDWLKKFINVSIDKWEPKADELITIFRELVDKYSTK